MAGLPRTDLVSHHTRDFLQDMDSGPSLPPILGGGRVTFDDGLGNELEAFPPFSRGYCPVKVLCASLSSFQTHKTFSGTQLVAPRAGLGAAIPNPDAHVKRKRWFGYGVLAALVPFARHFKVRCKDGPYYL
jgi:hypothetical protein